MTTDSAELKGMLAHCAGTPDDTARLVLADWLEDHDDFRAEFVRLAVEFDRTPPYDIKRFQLGARLRALLEMPAFKEWLPANACFKWGWRRGLLTLIANTDRMEVEDLTEVAGWLASDWIERVEFEGGRIGWRPNWEDTFELVHNTRAVHFGNDDYGPEVLARLREWPYLRELSLPHLYLTDSWAELVVLPHLRALHLNRPDGQVMPELHKARLPNLEVLDLNKEWEGDLPHWATCFPKLRSLTLTQYNGYPQEQCERFAECSQLRHLAFYQKYEPFTRGGLRTLARLTELRSLGIGPLPPESIAGLAKLPRLEHLATDTNGRQVKRIQGLESLAQLRWLSLGANTLTRGITEQVLQLPHLSRLNLHLGAFEAGAIAALANAPALRALSVTFADMHARLEELGRLEQIQYLWVWRRELIKPELLALQTALPGCQIIDSPPTAEEDDYDWSY
jgi:uncharacterized protein (TIGR02996 family)